MKIVCDSCGAKYSIADEKVRGKVFKIRCKKCSEVIVVRGDSGADDIAAPSAAGADSGQAPTGGFGDAIWHLVVNGEQQGPFSPDQISQMLSSGQVDWEAYAWRDGLDGWLHMRELDELVAAITGQPAPSTPAPEPQAAGAGMFTPAPKPASSELFGGGDGGGGFTAPEPSPAAARSSAPAASGRARAGGADLFAAASSEKSAFSAGSASDDDDVVASKHDPSGGGGLTGARNENSVLFSLSNLQALATKGQAAPASTGFSAGGTAPASGGGARAGFAAGSGSGLIDIRALSGDGGGSSSPSSSSSSSGGIDDLLSIGGPSAFAPTLGAPVLMPASRGEGGKLLYVLLGVAALLVLGIIGLVVVILTRDNNPPAAVVVPPPVVQQAAQAPSGPSAAAPAAPTNEQPVPSEPSSEEPAPGGGGSRRGSGGAGGHGAPTKGGAAAPASAPTKQAAATPEPTKRADSRTADLDDLIGGALGEHRATKAASGGGEAAPAAPRGNLPAQPSRGDVGSAMSAVNGAVRGCSGGQTGTASIRIVFASSGRVTTASVTSPPFAGTPAGSCMARAVKSARVPPFSNPSLTVTFPFVVR